MSRRSPGHSNLRVSQVQLRDFRGVTGDAAVSFAHKNGKPSSCIVFGENGTGKSSIVDAVEWACQGKIGRSSKFSARSRPHLFNLATNAETCSVAVTLTDGTVLGRKVRRDPEKGTVVSASGESDGFQYVPMSLKRSDILNFLELPPERRGTLLLDHYLGQEHATPSEWESEQETEDVLVAAKTHVRQAAAAVAQILGVDPPHELSDVKVMVNNVVYKSVAPRHRKSISLARNLVDPVAALELALTDFEESRVRRRKTTQVSTQVTERVRRTHAILGDVSEWLSSSFQRVTGAGHVARISAELGRLGPMSLELDVELSTGFVGAPQKVFSEGYQDLIALLYFLAVARAAGEQGQAKVLILDDVLQSVDATIRVRVMNLILDEFADWQLLITVHDRLWRAQLLALFQSAGHPVAEVEIRNWGFTSGPSITYGTGQALATADLENALAVGDPAPVCAVSGRLLEHVCDTMSWTLPISVKRRRGDRYTLADLWPGVRKELSKTTLSDVANEIEVWMHLRNAVGAHYNDWAEGVTWSDAENFGLSVLALTDSLYCSKCGQWVIRSGSQLACRCGHKQVS